MKFNTFTDGVITESVEVPDDPTDVAERNVQGQVEEALDSLRAIRDTTGTLTAAQLSNAARLFAKVLIHLIRMQLRHFDGTD